jgi:putative endonuclease
METYTVYIISNPENIYYKGYTCDVGRRLEEHNSPLGKYTSHRGPWVLKFVKNFSSRTEALKYEAMLKRQNHRYLDWLISSDKNELER